MNIPKPSINLHPDCGSSSCGALYSNIVCVIRREKGKGKENILILLVQTLSVFYNNMRLFNNKTVFVYPLSPPSFVSHLFAANLVNLHHRMSSQDEPNNPYGAIKFGEFRKYMQNKQSKLKKQQKELYVKFSQLKNCALFNIFTF